MSAARYLLRRMQEDPRLAYLIGPGSEAYDRLIADAAADMLLEPAELRAKHAPTLTCTPWPQADGPLTVAAPALLEICEELSEAAEYWSEYDVPLGIVDRLKTAIAKARGTL